MCAVNNHFPHKRAIPISLRTQYRKMKKKINKAFDSLLLLERDHTLLVEYAYEIFFAVDYHEMYSFAFPFDDLLRSGTDIFSDDTINSITNAQIARAYLFYGKKDIVGPPILLPPHEQELRRTLRQFIKPESEFLSAILQVNNIKQFDSIITNELKKFPKVRRAYDRFLDSGEVPKDSYTALFEYFEKRFRPLTHALSGAATGGFSDLRKLITSELNKEAPVQYAFRVWPQFMNFIEEKMKTALKDSIWKEKFKEIRGEELSISNKRDTQALELVFGLNKKMNIDKKVILVVSNVYSMQSVLNQSKRDGMLRIKDLDEPLPILRTLDTFLAYLFYAKGDSKKTLENIRRNRIRLGKMQNLELVLERLVSSCDAKSSYPEEEECLACPVRKHCEAAAKTLDELKQEMDKLDKIHLVIKGAPYLKEFVSPNKLAGEMRKTVKTMLDFIEASSVVLKNDADKKEKDILNKLDENRRKFAIQLVGYLRDLILNKVKFSTEFKRDEERSRELISLIFTKYRLKFTNREIIDVFKKMRGLINRKHEDTEGKPSGKMPFEEISYEEMTNEQKLFLAMLHLIELSGRKDIDKIEQRLLLSALFLAHKKYRHSMRIALDTRDELETPKEKTEFFYIEMMVRFLWAKDAKFSWYDYLRQVELSKKVLILYPKDGRFNNIHGLIMGDLIEEVLRENSEEVSKKVQCNFDNVIKCFEDAFGKVDKCESDLLGVILNNWAWYLYRRGREGDLFSAIEKIEQMEGIPNLEWRPDFSHTQGTVLLGLAKEEKEDDKPDWKCAAEKAVVKIRQCVSRAIELKYAKEVLDIYEEDLSKAKEFLGSS